MQILFFALTNDLLPVLEAVEREQPVRYTKTGNQLDPVFDSWQSVSETWGLGSTNLESAVGSDRYLVTARSCVPKVRCVPCTDGSNRYCMDQLINPDSVTIAPGGTFGPDTVISGGIGTCSDSEFSRSLFALYRREIRRQYRKVRAYWVGPAAHEIFVRCGRLCSAIQSPREYDLAPEH